LELTDFQTPFGAFQLNRLPVLKRENLRAWDAADEYLLQQIAEDNLLAEGEPVLVLNDAFGALALGLKQGAVTSWNDSVISHQAARFNRQQNQLATDFVAVPSTELPTGPFKLVVIKVPKTLALLEHQLALLSDAASGLLEQGARVIAAGMVKGIHTSTLALFEKYLGPTTTSLAKKKARLIFPQITALQPQPSPYPSRYHEDTCQLELLNHANVFSR